MNALALEELTPVEWMIANFKNMEFRLSAPIISSLTIMAIVAILCTIVGIEARVQDPLKKPRGLLLLATSFVEWLESWTRDMMGCEPGNWPGYFMCLFVYLFMSFVWSVTGFPSVIDYLVCPLVLSIVMFILIQFTAIRYQKWGYFHRYIEPVVFWLPINLLTMWTPIISTSLRMFGNCLSGSVIIGILNWVLRGLSAKLFSFLGSSGQIVLSPIVIGVLNLYFGLFSGYVQTLVFASLNGVWIGAEIPETSPMGNEGQAIRSQRDKAI